MRCIVTAGPTFEPLDQVRRLTNFSTGGLGGTLANYLSVGGHDVTLLLGQQASWSGACQARSVERFGSAEELRHRLAEHANAEVDAVFHAAAVGDFKFGKIWSRTSAGELVEMRSGKISTRGGVLLAELVPTVKIISELRTLFPEALLVGWKYEVDGDRASAVQAAANQIAVCRTNACVANGPAYGAGFGFVEGLGRCAHLAGKPELFAALERFARGHS